jgi:hypothetical protein
MLGRKKAAWTAAFFDRVFDTGETMSVAWYIVLERKIPGFDHGVNGQSRAGKALDALAQEAGVQPLMDFFCASAEELTGFAEDRGIELKEKAIKLAPEKWFPANEGLRTARALIQAGI